VVTTPPDQPRSSLAKDVRNNSFTGSVFGPTTAALSGDTVEFRITYSNLGTGTGHSVVVTDVIPAGLFFVDGSCMPPDVTGASCSYVPPTLTIGLGDVPAGKSTTAFFRATVGCTNGTISNVANGKAKEESTATGSTPATVTTTCG
jgi:uncharacterized repeat protein (TIGR01451 family)